MSPFRSYQSLQFLLNLKKKVPSEVLVLLVVTFLMNPMMVSKAGNHKDTPTRFEPIVGLVDGVRCVWVNRSVPDLKISRPEDKIVAGI